MEFRGIRRVNKPQSGLFSSHYYISRPPGRQAGKQEHTLFKGVKSASVGGNCEMFRLRGT